ncbi:MAG: gfo/Idh/MocA family oxidoreductase [Candidatus Eisenbacteria bacterium]|nr:gfo/Idh/MocA family oxidoreductase [Candidatus Eisenbacteria bacterium]
MTRGKSRWAVIGNGFGRHTVLPCLGRIKKVRVVALCGRNSERARETAQQFGIPEIYTDYRSMITETKPDLVVVTSPPHLHKEMSLFALEHGCHVMCEKPTALDADEAQSMYAAAQETSDRLAMIDHELRFDPVRAHMRQLIEEGYLGRVRQVTWTQRSGGMASADRPFDWWHIRSRGGGLLGAIGSHAVDLLRHWVGELEEVWGDLRTQIPERPDPGTGEMREVETDDAFTALLRFRADAPYAAPGAVARLDMNVASPGPWASRLEVLGTEGRLYLDDAGVLRGCQSSSGVWEEIAVKEEISKADRKEIPDTIWARAFLRQARLVAEALLAGQTQVDGVATFADGWRNQQVIDAIHAAASEGCWSEVTEELTAAQPGAPPGPVVES